MKKVLFLILWALTVISAEAETVKVSTSPSAPLAGQQFLLKITVDTQKNFDVELPENIKGITLFPEFSGRSHSWESINGQSRVQNTLSFRATANAPGEVTIPAIKVKLGNKSMSSEPLTLTVRDAGNLPASEVISAKLNILPARNIYVGETIRANIALFIPAQTALRNINGITLNDFAGSISISGNEFAVENKINRPNGTLWELGSMQQVQQSGTFKPECRLELILAGNNFADPFGFNSERRTVYARTDRELNVLPLPPAPDGSINTGLIGSWQCRAKLSKNELRAGDIAELTLTFSGRLPVMLFHAPEINIPDTRIYPAEVKKNRDNTVIEVKYPFVPLKAGKYFIKLPMAIFDPVKGEYRITDQDIAFETGVNPALQNTLISEKNIPPSNAVPAEETKNTDLIPFPVIKPGNKILLPLWRNSIVWTAGMVITGALFLAISFFPLKHCRHRNRKEKILQEIVREINRSGKPAQVLLKYGPHDIADALGLPPSSGFDGIAEKVDDPETAEFFRTIAAAGFIPGEKILNEESGIVRKKVCAFLKNLTILLITVTTAFLTSGNFDAGKTAFDAGNYIEAQKKFSAGISGKNEIDPAMLYNLGCAQYISGDNAGAYISFTRAALLEPWETRYRTAAEKAASGLPVIPDDPPLLAQLTMFMRPDHGIAAAALFFSVAAICCLWRKKWSAALFIPVEFVCILLLAASLIITFYLTGTRYSPDNAMITVNGSYLRSTPSQNGGRQTPLAAGTMVIIREEKGDFYRIELPGGGGWISRNDVQRIFPYKVF